jgi:hypothetical protein
MQALSLVHPAPNLSEKSEKFPSEAALRREAFVVFS